MQYFSRLNKIFSAATALLLATVPPALSLPNAPKAAEQLGVEYVDSMESFHDCPSGEKALKDSMERIAGRRNIQYDIQDSRVTYVLFFDAPRRLDDEFLFYFTALQEELGKEICPAANSKATR